MRGPGADLPPPIESLVARAVAASGLTGAPAEAFAADLRAHFEDGLEAGVPAERLMERFGDPESAGRAVGEVKGGGSPVVDRPLRRAATRGGPVWTDGWAGVRRAVRTLGRAPGFALVVIFTLALGVGANTAVFSVLDAVLLEPLPYDEPDELVRIYERYTGEGATGGTEFLRAPVVWELRDWDDVFDEVAVMYTYREQGADITDGATAQRLVTSRVSAGFFETLGIEPALGRTFRADESYGVGAVESGSGGEVGAPVVILTHALWMSRFGGDREAVGRSIQLDGVSYEVVGVMPAGFRNPLGPPADLWTPLDLRTGGSNTWGNYYLTGIGRLAGGSGLEAARGRLGARVQRLAEANPRARDFEAVLEPLHTDVVGSGRRTMLWVLAGAVALVLLSACVNVANLVLTRSLGRRRDVAVRGALGADRGRLVGHLLLESGLLALAGGAVGLLLGALTLEFLPLLAPEALPALVTPRLNARVFLFALGATGIATALFGIAPAVQLSRTPPAQVLRGGGRGGTETRSFRRVRNTLAVAQVALAVVLVVGAGLLVRSFAAQRDAPLGFDPDPVLTYEVHLPEARYPDGPSRHELHERLLGRVAALPGVEAAGAVSWLPVNGRFHTWGLELPEGAPDYIGVDVRIIAGGYFEALGIPVLRGAPPGQVDLTGEDVMWISTAAARATFGDADPVGRQLNLNGLRRVVGVVADVAHNPRGEMVRQVYLPHEQYADNRNWALTHAVRSSGPPEALEPRIRGLLAELDPELVMYRPQAFSALVAAVRAQDRFAMSLMGVFALLATVLAGVGTYAVLSESVAGRRKEIGIRMALGADAGTVRGLILRNAGALVLTGTVLGAAGAWWGARYLAPLLFRVPPTDPIAFALGIGGIAVVGLLAGWLPSLRATRVDPIRTLGAD